MRRAPGRHRRIRWSFQPLRSANSAFAASTSVVSRSRSLAVRLRVLATQQSVAERKIGNSRLTHIPGVRGHRFLAYGIPQFECRHDLADVAEIG